MVPLIPTSVEQAIIFLAQLDRMSEWVLATQPRQEVVELLGSLQDVKERLRVIIRKGTN